MIDPCREVDLWWLEWVIGREVNCKEEYAALEWTVTGSHDRCLPVELNRGQLASLRRPGT